MAHEKLEFTDQVARHLRNEHRMKLVCDYNYMTTKKADNSYDIHLMVRECYQDIVLEHFRMADLEPKTLIVIRDEKFGG